MLRILMQAIVFTWTTLHVGIAQSDCVFKFVQRDVVVVKEE